MNGVRIAIVVAACAFGAGCPSQTTLHRNVWFRATAQEMSEAAHSTHGAYLRDLGSSLVAEERWDDARATYEEARSLQYGDDFETQIALGDLYERAGDWKGAVAAYGRASTLRPGHPGGWYNLRRVAPKMQTLKSSMAEDKPADAAAAPEAAGG